MTKWKSGNDGVQQGVSAQKFLFCFLALSPKTRRMFEPVLSR
jgi:hypothetical protein